MVESIPFTLAGVNGTTNIMTGVTFTGGDSLVYIGLLEDGASDDQGEDKLVMEEGTDSGNDEFDGILAEDKTSDIAVYTEQGSSSNSAAVLNGVTVAAS
jgi:hypothetical protein